MCLQAHAKFGMTVHAAARHIVPAVQGPVPTSSGYPADSVLWLHSKLKRAGAARAHLLGSLAHFPAFALQAPHAFLSPLHVQVSFINRYLAWQYN